MIKPPRVTGFYNQITPRLPEHSFAFSADEIVQLGKLLRVDLEIYGPKLSFFTRIFANNIALYDLALDWKTLLDYLQVVSATAGKLAFLLQMPPNAPPDLQDLNNDGYRKVQPFVAAEFAHWLPDNHNVLLERLIEGVDFIARLSKSAMRDYSQPKKAQARGPWPDLNLSSFLAELITIVYGAAGGDSLKLPSNELRRVVKTPLLRFMRTMVDSAIAKGRSAAAAAELPPDQKTAALERLDEYKVMNSTLITYARPLTRRIQHGQFISSYPRFGLPSHSRRK
jgi:hypothetical protein